MHKNGTWPSWEKGPVELGVPSHWKAPRLHPGGAEGQGAANCISSRALEREDSPPLALSDALDGVTS
jgi:hypothetical protein